MFWKYLITRKSQIIKKKPHKNKFMLKIKTFRHAAIFETKNKNIMKRFPIKFN